jgi:glycosyltransferase involved in cell wall biosynthesis
MLGAKHDLILLQREGSEQNTYGMKTRPIPRYNIAAREADVKTLTSVCKKLKIDLFITTYQTRVKGIKSLTFVYDLIPEILGWLPRSIEAVSRKEDYLLSDILVCISKNTKKDLYSWYDMTSKQVEMVYLGVSSEDFHPLASCENAGFMEKYKLKSNYIVLDGAILPEAAEIFCKVFSSLNTNFSLLSYGGALKKEVVASCLKYKILYQQVGFLSDKEVLMALSGSKGLIFLSPNEGFGLPVLEAMACKIPVLCSHMTSLPEVGGDSVYYFTDHTYTGIKNGLVPFLNIKDRYQLVEKGYTRSKLFTWEKTVQKLVGIILR